MSGSGGWSEPNGGERILAWRCEPCAKVMIMEFTRDDETGIAIECCMCGTAIEVPRACPAVTPGNVILHLQLVHDETVIGDDEQLAAEHKTEAAR